MTDDPSATYRGFRSQALYVLHRLLKDPNRAKLIFRPEGDEDLAIYDHYGALIEAVQVKDFSSPLALSNFKPQSVHGFFGRLKARRIKEPQCRTKIATYGPLGPELSGAIKNEEKPRRDVIRKIKHASDWKNGAEIADALESLDGNVEGLDRDELESEIREALRATAIGGDVDVAMDILMYWVFDASERTRDITESLLVEKIHAVGQFLIDSRDFSAEWGTSILPIQTTKISAQRRQELVSEYRHGVDARFEHIIASADSPRKNLLDELRESLKKYPVAIVRGASGQGKSSLGWRYLLDHCADGLRFQIRHLESIQQAMRIANALELHIRKLRLPATVFLDVSPKSVGWPELVREFSRFGIRTLVCVREEDFLRGGVGDFQFDYGVVSLQQIRRDEAAGIYDSLSDPSQSATLNFEDAWTLFEESGGGPLMEFTHLIAAGDSLSSRLGHQIDRLRSDADKDGSVVSSSHLRMLAVAAIANSAGARVSYQRLCKEVGLDRITDPIRMIENEYLFRVVEDGGKTFIAGLHSFRSQAIVKAFFGKDREMISEYSAKALRLVVDSDIRSFLLHVFAEDGISSVGTLAELTLFAPRSWAHVCGIAEALIWYGLDSYERANRETIAKLVQKYQRAWLFACDVFVGLKGTSPAIASSFPNFDPAEAQLTPKIEVFQALKSWLETAAVPDSTPEESDWGRLGDLMFWAGFTDATGAIPTALQRLEINITNASLRCSDLGRWVTGRSEIAGAEFDEWHESISEELRSKFLKDTHSVDLADDGTEVAVAYALTPMKEAGEDSVTAIDSNLNRATMMRVNFLRLLYPRRDLYSGKAFGAAELRLASGFDDSEKRIQASNLHAPLGVRLNANFRNLVSYRHERPESWKDYIGAVMAYRKSAGSFSEKTAKFWSQMLGASESRRGTMTGYPTKERVTIIRNDFPPKFPAVAVDRFGFADDGGAERSEGADAKEQEDPKKKRTGFIERFSGWQKSMSDYSSSLSAFANHSAEISIRFRSGNSDFSQSESGNDLGHLALACASMAWEALDLMQTEFRQHFLLHVGDRRLRELEKKEQIALEKLWAATLSMQYHRFSVKKNLAGQVLARLKAKQDQFPKALMSGLDHEAVRQVSISPKAIGLGGDRCLVIVCDYPDMDTLDEDSGTLVEELAKATRLLSWRPYEWQGVVSSWPMIALVKTINGKAWAPLVVKISTSVVMMSNEEFNAKAHHRAFSEVSPEDFEQTGASLREHPALRALCEVQQTLLRFAAAIEIHMEILEYVSNMQLSDSEVRRVATGYLEEVSKARRGFADSCNQAQAIISQSSEIHGESLGKRIGFVKLECTQILNLSLFAPSPTLDVPETAESTNRFRNGIDAFRQLFFNSVDILLTEDSKN